MTGFDILFSKFGFYDAIIFLLAAAELIILFFCISSVRHLETALDPARGTGRRSKRAQAEKKQLQSKENKVKDTLDKAIRWSYLYDDVASLFTIFGILGTVMALLPMVSSDNMQSNFTVALTTTAWGIIFSIVFKLLGSSLSARLDIFHEDANKYLEREYQRDLIEGELTEPEGEGRRYNGEQL